MARHERLDDVVNACAERMARGESLETCLANYPEISDQLAPLLEVVATTLMAVSDVSPDTMARKRGLQKLNEVVARRSTHKPVQRFPRFIWQSPISRPVVTGAIVLLVVATGMAFGANAASSNSIPGDSLYWIKTSKESLMMMVPKSAMARAKDHARLAQKRGSELEILLDRGKHVEAQNHFTRVNRNLVQSVELVGMRNSMNVIEIQSQEINSTNRVELDAFRASLEKTLVTTHSVLAIHLVSASPEERLMILGLMHRNKLLYQTFIAFLESGGSPSWIPFYRTEPPRRFSRQRPGSNPER